MFLRLSAALLVFFVTGATAVAEEIKITQKGKQFSQEKITIKAGDSVVFENDDDTSHNVFSSTEGAKFNLGIQKQGTSSTHKFEKPGVVEIRCAIHPKMKLTVEVK